MPREIEPPSIQREFLLAALAEGKRIDGRIPLEMREVKLTFGESLGWVECHLGKTAWVAARSTCFEAFSLTSCRVLAQVSAEIVKPREDRPYEGFLLINSEISPMAS